MTDRSGRSSQPDAAVAAADHTLANGGGTFDAVTLAPVYPTSGYAVGVYPGTWRTVRVYAGADSHPAERADLSRAIKACAADIGAAYVGTWTHDGVVDVDPITIVETHAEALALARANGQHAIYSFAEQRTYEID